MAPIIRNPLSLLLAVSLIGLGFFLGRLSDPGRDERAPDVPLPPTLPTATPFSGGRSPSAVSPESKSAAPELSPKAFVQQLASRMSGMSGVSDYDVLLETWAELSGLSPERLEQVAAEVVRIPPPTRHNLQILLFSQWAKTDAPAAAEAVLKYTRDSFSRSLCLSNIMARWVEFDPDAAWAHYEERLMPSSGRVGSQGIESHLFSALGRQDFGKALERLTDITRPQIRERALAGLSEVAFKDPALQEQLWAAIDREEDDGLRLRALGAASYQWALREPQECAAWLAQETSLLTDERQFYQNALSQAWMKSSPQQAVEWLLSWAEGPADQENAVRRFASVQDYLPPKELLDWADGLPAELRSDAVFRTTAEQLTARDPSLAIRAAAQIEEQPVRTQSIKSVYRQWVRTDPERARAWRDQSPYRNLLDSGGEIDGLPDG